MVYLNYYLIIIGLVLKYCNFVSLSFQVLFVLNNHSVLYIFFSFAKFQCFHRNLGFFTILLSNSLYGISDKAPRIFAPHLDPNCLQRSSTVFTMTKSYTMFSTKFLKASAFFVNKGTLTDSILFFRNTWRWQIFWRHVQEWKQLIDS